MATQALKNHPNDVYAHGAAELTGARKLGARGSRTEIGHDDPAGDPGDLARGVLAGLSDWWATAAEVHGLSGHWLSLEDSIEGIPPAPFSETPVDLCGLPAREIGARYAAALSVETRSRHGRHYTPALLAEQLWSMTRLSLGQRRPGLPLPGLVCDPACGGGALLLPALRQHVASLSEADPRVALTGMPRLIQGIDADPSAVWMANVVLASELLPLVARIRSTRRRPLPLLAQVGDGLASAKHPTRAVVMNPPYGRVRLDQAERTRWGRYLYGHANLYSMFLGSGLERLDSQGVLSAIVPTSFLAGRYFASLRLELADAAPLHSLTFVEERDGVFAGVLQETCLAVFSRRRSRRTSVASANGRVAAVAKVSSPRGQGPWILPRRADDAHVAAAAAAMPLTLAAAGWRVSTGPLVWNRRRADLGPRRGRRRAAPVIWAADLDGGRLHRDSARDTLRWLQLSGSDDPVLLLREAAVLVQRTTAPEQGRRLVCTQLTPDELRDWGGEVVVENHVNVIRPIEGGDQALSLGTLAALLSTKTVDRLIRCITGSVAVSAYELESLPMPDAATMATWESKRGEDLEAAVSSAYQPALR
jgi:adenine-specific DNA-methyltransferase